jgi:two-component system, chemotaxis family, protein-glutamate methylesterase/glutaminase
MTNFLRLQYQPKNGNLVRHTFDRALNYDILVIGASTGGPEAIEFIVTNIPLNLAIPVVIAQHMPEHFIISFAERLTMATGLKVKVAQQDEPLLPTHIYFAPGTANIRLDMSSASPMIRYVHDQYKEFNHPSIDCLFGSIGKAYGKRAIGVILTGMGKDGTGGLMEMKNAGGLTIAQDEASSVVYGMPRSAAESGAALHQMPLGEMPLFISNAL